MLDFLESIDLKGIPAGPALIVTAALAATVSLLGAYVLFYVVYLRKKKRPETKAPEKTRKPEREGLNDIMGYDFIKIVYPKAEAPSEKPSGEMSFEESVGRGMSTSTVHVETLGNDESDYTDARDADRRQQGADRIGDPIDMTGDNGAVPEQPVEETGENIPETERGEGEDGNIVKGQDASELDIVWDTSGEEADLARNEDAFNEFMTTCTDASGEEDDEDRELASLTDRSPETVAREEEAYEGLRRKMIDTRDALAKDVETDDWSRRLMNQAEKDPDLKLKKNKEENE